MASQEAELQAQVVSLSNRVLEANLELQTLQEQSRTASREASVQKARNTELESENATLSKRVAEMEAELADLSSSLLDEANQQVSEANKRAAAAHLRVEERDGVIASQSAELQALKEMLERNHEKPKPMTRQRTFPSDQRFPVDQRHPVEQRFANDPRAASPRVGHQSMHSPSSSMSHTGLPSPSIRSGVSTPAANSPVLGAEHAVGSGSFVGNGFGGMTDLGSPRLPSSSAGSNSLRRVAQEVSGMVDRDLILDLDAYASPTRPLIRTDLRDYRDFLDAWGSELRAHSSLFKLQEPWRRSSFVQRVIKEDIEATLRVDKSPHLSFLNIRAFLNGVLDLTISIEPVSSTNVSWSNRPSQPCLLCGESRMDEKYERIYWAQAAPDADRLVLDLTCVAKTQLACELVSFLRHIAKLKDGDDTQKERAWRQCNTMREQLFWARSGGLFPEAPDMLATIQTSAADDFEFELSGDEAEVEENVLNATAERPPKLGSNRVVSPSSVTTPGGVGSPGGVVSPRATDPRSAGGSRFASPEISSLNTVRKTGYTSNEHGEEVREADAPHPPQSHEDIMPAHENAAHHLSGSLSAKHAASSVSVESNLDEFVDSRETMSPVKGATPDFHRPLNDPAKGGEEQNNGPDGEITSKIPGGWPS